MENNDIFSSLISDIKTYSGKDPLLPWLRGIRKMKDSLPSRVLNEKLPRFLQKCAEKFESDRRYRDDLRYLRVWLQLMDYVDDPRAVLKTMEDKCIGTKWSLFYQAYALYYEKLKKFDDADKMYHLGVQKLAEPVDELQRSYEQFLHRMKRYNLKRIQHQQSRISIRYPSDKSTIPNCGDIENNNAHRVEAEEKGTLQEGSMAENIDGSKETVKMRPEIAERGVDGFRMLKSDDTVIVKFVGTAICGKSDAEDACHHGLVEPTVNMKEAMNAINSMFSEPLEMATVARRSRKSQVKKDQNLSNGFEVFVDENQDKKSEFGKMKGIAEFSSPDQQPLKIFVDDEARGGSTEPKCGNQFLFPYVENFPSQDSDDSDKQDSIQAKFREDTVVRKFVGTAITNEPKVENICHNGLVEPTVNLKEAMDDINNMFGKPIEFVRTRRTKKHEKPPQSEDGQKHLVGFSILPDDELEPARVQPQRECDLFEPTAFTKEAMDDINKMFGMPLDI